MEFLKRETPWFESLGMNKIVKCLLLSFQNSSINMPSKKQSSIGARSRSASASWRRRAQMSGEDKEREKEQHRAAMEEQRSLQQGQVRLEDDQLRQQQSY